MQQRRILTEIKRISHPIDHYNPEHQFYYNACVSDYKQGTILMLGVEDSPYFGGFYYLSNEFTSEYPYNPPKWRFISNIGSFRYNPNLYSDGKVCLSLIGTWDTSTWCVAQTLGSVINASQAHLFVKNALTNEPNIPESDIRCPIYDRMIMYENLNSNIYTNLMLTPDHAKPFMGVMVENFMKNIDYFQKYINNNYHLDGKKESISYHSCSVTYNFKKLQTKFEEMKKHCEKILSDASKSS